MRVRGFLTPLRFVVIAVVAALLTACGPARTMRLGVHDGAMLPCPSRPNCVCSDGSDPSHHVGPLRLTSDSTGRWPEVREVVAAMPRTRIVEEHGTYLHAECRSAVFRFVDDLELDLRTDDGVIAVRSASRLGYSDMGVNRRRVEQLRGVLQDRGIVER